MLTHIVHFSPHVPPVRSYLVTLPGIPAFELPVRLRQRFVAALEASQGDCSETERLSPMHAEMVQYAGSGRVRIALPGQASFELNSTLIPEFIRALELAGERGGAL